MKKHLWLVFLVVGLILMVTTVVSIAVPFLSSMATPSESIAIIGGADGPAAQHLTQRLFWGLLQGRVWIFLVGVILVIAAVTLKILGKKK